VTGGTGRPARAGRPASRAEARRTRRALTACRRAWCRYLAAVIDALPGPAGADLLAGAARADERAPFARFAPLLEWLWSRPATLAGLAEALAGLRPLVDKPDPSDADLLDLAARYADERRRDLARATAPDARGAITTAAASTPRADD
jgi:hypothetical protein